MMFYQMPIDGVDDDQGDGQDDDQNIEQKQVVVRIVEVLPKFLYDDEVQ